MAAPSRSTATSRRVRRSTPVAAQRAAIPPMRSLSVGARQRMSSGGAAMSGWTRRPSASSSTDVWSAGPFDRAVLGGSSAFWCRWRVPWRWRRWRPAPATSPPTGSWSAHTSKPAGAHASAPAVVNRTVSQASPGPCPAGSIRVAGPSRVPGLQARQVERLACDPGAVDRQEVVGSQPSVSRKCWWLETPAARPRGPRLPPRSGRCGERPVLPHRGLRPAVGPDEPVGHEVAVMRLVPKSPP